VQDHNEHTLNAGFTLEEDLFIQKGYLKQSYFFEDESKDTFKIGSSHRNLFPRADGDTTLFKMAIKIDSLKVSYDKKTYGMP